MIKQVRGRLVVCVACPQPSRLLTGRLCTDNLDVPHAVQIDNVLSLDIPALVKQFDSPFM